MHATCRVQASVRSITNAGQLHTVAQNIEAHRERAHTLQKTGRLANKNEATRLQRSLSATDTRDAWPLKAQPRSTLMQLCRRAAWLHADKL